MVMGSITITHDRRTFELPQPLGTAWLELRYHRRDLYWPDELERLILAHRAAGLPTAELESTLQCVLGRIAGRRAMLGDAPWREQVLNQLRAVTSRREVPIGWSNELAACFREQLGGSVAAPTRSVDLRRAQAGRVSGRHRRPYPPNHAARPGQLVAART